MFHFDFTEFVRLSPLGSTVPLNSLREPALLRAVCRSKRRFAFRAGAVRRSIPVNVRLVSSLVRMVVIHLPSAFRSILFGTDQASFLTSPPRFLFASHHR